jgi:hypothetical protein
MLPSLAGCAGALLLGMPTVRAAVQPNEVRIATQPVQPVYARIAIPPKTTVYVEFRDRDMRTATSVAGLRTAKPVRSGGLADGPLRFPWTVLPLEPKSLPEGYTEIRALLNLDQVLFSNRSSAGESSTRPQTATWYVYGHVCPRRADRQKTTWTYWFRVGAQAGGTADTAPVLRVPDMTNPKVNVVAQADKRNLLIGVRATINNIELSDIRKTLGGKEYPYSPVQVTVRDPAGTTVVTERGRLDKFGFG